MVNGWLPCVAKPGGSRIDNRSNFTRIEFHQIFTKCWMHLQKIRGKTSQRGEPRFQGSMLGSQHWGRQQPYGDEGEDRVN
jgi:hypothetical protein